MVPLELEKQYQSINDEDFIEIAERYRALRHITQNKTVRKTGDTVHM